MLLGHGLNGDLSYLKRVLKLDVQQILPIVAVIDTEIIGQAVLQTPKGPSVTTLLTQLGCPSGHHRNLHVAGNDAMFAMKVLLALALCTKWKEPSSLRKQIELIAFAPVRGAEIQEKIRQQDSFSRRISGVWKHKNSRGTGPICVRSHLYLVMRIEAAKVIRA